MDIADKMRNRRSILAYIQAAQTSIREFGSSLLSTLERIPTSNCIIAVLRLLLRDCSNLEQVQKCLLKNQHLLESGEIVGSTQLQDPALRTARFAFEGREGNDKPASWYEDQYRNEMQEMGSFISLCDKWVCELELGIESGDITVKPEDNKLDSR